MYAVCQSDVSVKLIKEVRQQCRWQMNFLKNAHITNVCGRRLRFYQASLLERRFFRKGLRQKDLHKSEE